MPNSQNNPPLSARELRSYLAGVLPSSELSVKSVDDDHEPLVLLQTDHIAVGFGFSNGDLKQSYDMAYKGFKSVFKEQKRIWDALDLAFVFCVHPDLSNLHQFCSNVETDVLFCRKFVVPVSSSLDSSFARLPFLPLAPLEGRTLRPASAQTFLHQCGVPSVLSRYIVVQRERGPERIIEDCLDGSFGAPANLSGANPPPMSEPDGDRETVSLDEITIRNFRAYRKPQTFPIGASVTVLYGPNGFGKTSFFDALDFAVTGDIGRLEISSDAHFLKVARHLDAGSEDATVTISIRSKDVPRKIVRNVKDRKQALLDDRDTDRKAILSELTGREIPVADRVENFVNLFRATHLFNQEVQELTKDFQEDCCLPAEIVSRMLAFQDYTNALTKISRICALLEVTIKTSENEIAGLVEEINDSTRELNRLNRASNVAIGAGSVESRFQELKLKLERAGLEPGEALPELSTIRQWRALIETKSAEIGNRYTRFSEIARELATLPATGAELSATEAQVTEKEQVLSSHEEARTSLETTVQALDRSVLELTSRVTNLAARQLLFDWYRLTRPTYLDLQSKRQVLNEQLTGIRSELDQLRLSEQNSANTLLTLEREADQANSHLNIRRRELDALQKLAGLLPSWQRNKTSLAAIAESESALQKSMEASRGEEKALDTQLNKLAEDEKRLAHQVEEIDQTQSDFRALLLQLQGHITSGTCPLCGQDHGTDQELLNRVKKELSRDPARAQRLDLTEIREKAKRLRASLVEIRAKYESAESQLSGLKRSRSECETEIGGFNSLAVESGIEIDTSVNNPEELLQRRSLPIQQEVEKLEGVIKNRSEALATARINAANAKKLLNGRSEEEKARSATLTDHVRELGGIQSDQRWLRLPLDSPPEQVASDETNVEAEIAAAKLELTPKQLELDQKKNEVAGLRREATTVRNQLYALRNRIANLQRRITVTAAKLESAKLSPETTEAKILALIAQETMNQEQFRELRDTAVNLEIALDAATTAAALRTLQQTIRNKEKALNQAKDKSDRHKPWLDYFLSISRLLISQQSKAIASFTQEYGPRTSVIQRRLRSVYGFDDIEIQSRDSRIQVRAKRNGEELRPTDYFSQSQQQTLLLGLFLTACISQTWSGFSSILLDDPVTHFDDLNTYAFLDLLVGLLESESGKRQFIISTCDEKLLLLARQKFRHLGSRAIFYRFDAIGDDGPVVQKING